MTRNKQLKLAQATRRSWTSFWAVLRGPMLGFYSSREACVHNEIPQRQLVVEGCLALPAEDRLKRPNVIMLALPTGDLFYLQADSEESCGAWVRELHLSALVAEAVTTNNDGLAKHIKQRLQQLERQLRLETDHKRVAQMQLSNGEPG